jgi:hypothetical protein
VRDVFRWTAGFGCYAVMILVVLGLDWQHMLVPALLLVTFAILGTRREDGPK